MVYSDLVGNYRRPELEEMIRKQNDIASNFYAQAIRVGNHAFIEFCGLMNEYTNMCRATLEANQDFTQANRHSGQKLVAKSHHIKYFAEKFECIFGGMFESAENQKIFMDAMGWKS